MTTCCENKGVPPGWIGGFAESNPAFAYPTPDLSSLPMLDNLANIDKLQRQQKVCWPEFSWETVPGDPKSRCFQMFSPDISRLGYTDTGRVYSIICPQQGVYSPSLGTMNVEVTVTGQRGWANETNKEIAADMTVTGKIWFTPSAKEGRLVQLLWFFFQNTGRPFPADKAHAIEVTTHLFQNPTQPIFPVRDGETTRFASPDFAKHPEAFSVANVEVQIGPIKKTGDAIVDEFNQLVLDFFNTGSGNLLKDGNLLSWNVWFHEPELVDQQEWRDHAEKWRKSIDTGHGSPTGDGHPARYFDGTPFNAVDAILQREIQKILDFLKRHL